MHDNMMIAEVGDIEKVSGSRIATPLAPPRPGNTPIKTPSVMPTQMRSRLKGSSTTAKPWNSAATSLIGRCPLGASSIPRPRHDLGHSITQHRLKRPFGERHQEPFLEGDERDDRHAERHRDRFLERIAAEPPHEQADENRRRDINAEQGDHQHEHRGRYQHRQHQPKLWQRDEYRSLLLVPTAA